MPFVNTNQGVGSLERIQVPVSRPNPTTPGKTIIMRGIVAGDWVDILCDDTVLMRQRVMRDSTFSDYDPVADKLNLRGDPWMMKLATLHEVVVAWGNGLSEEPKYPEVNETLINGMFPEVADFIYDEWKRLSAGRTDEAKNASRPTSSAGRPRAIRSTSPQNSAT